ncbi:MAG TPA: hypothetical protein VI821_00230 [Candidatus Paceibacterota bacterium]
MSFCEKCGNLMLRNFTPDEIVLRCSCGFSRPARDNETLIVEENIGVVLGNYKNILNTAYKDAANPLERKYCDGCKREVIVKIVRITDQMLKFYVCESGHIFSN